jgi:hypothetical protein
MARQMLAIVKTSDDEATDAIQACGGSAIVSRS